MGNYTPLQAGAVPTLNTSGPAVAALQTQLNQTNAGKAGYVPLAVDSKYGPLTDAAAKLANPSSQLSVTSKGAATTFTNNASKINDYLNAITPNQTANPQPQDDATIAGSDPIIQGLKNLQNTSDVAQNRLISEAMASYQNQANSTNQQYENYKHGLQLIGIQHNEAQSSPDLLMSQVQSAANEQLQKISDLKAAEAKAIMTAQDAIATKDQTTLNQETARLDTIHTQQRQALIDLHTAITQAPKLISAQISPSDASAIYDELSKMDPADHQAAIEALASKLGISPLTIVSGLQADIAAGNKATLATANSQATLDKKLKSGGSGGKGAATITPAQVNQGAQILKTGVDANGNKLGNPMGSDGYADPSVITALYNDWPGTTAEFISKYGKSINPAAKGLVPAAILPKQTKSSSSSTPSNPYSTS